MRHKRKNPFIGYKKAVRFGKACAYAGTGPEGRTIMKKRNIMILCVVCLLTIALGIALILIISNGCGKNDPEKGVPASVQPQSSSKPGKKDEPTSTEPAGEPDEQPPEDTDAPHTENKTETTPEADPTEDPFEIEIPIPTSTPTPKPTATLKPGETAAPTEKPTPTPKPTEEPTPEPTLDNEPIELPELP